MGWWAGGWRSADEAGLAEVGGWRLVGWWVGGWRWVGRWVVILKMLHLYETFLNLNYKSATLLHFYMTNGANGYSTFEGVFSKSSEATVFPTKNWANSLQFGPTSCFKKKRSQELLLASK